MNGKKPSGLWFLLPVVLFIAAVVVPAVMVASKIGDFANMSPPGVVQVPGTATVEITAPGDYMILLADEQNGRQTLPPGLTINVMDPKGDAVKLERTSGAVNVQSGNYGGTEYWYFDTADELNGAIFETAANVDAMPEPDRTYPE